MKNPSCFTENLGNPIVRNATSTQSANTANRAQKLEGRINAHRSTIRDEVKVQGAWQGLKQAGKCVFGEEKKPCEK